MFFWTETSDSLRQHPSIWPNELTQQQYILETIEGKTKDNVKQQYTFCSQYLRAEEFTV